MPGEDPLTAGRAVSGGPSDSGKNPGCVYLRRRDRFPPRSALRLAAVFAGLSPVTAAAQAGAGISTEGASIGTFEVIQFAVFAGVLGAAMLSAIWLIRERTRIATENADLRSRVADLNAALQRSEALLNLRDQRIVAWSGDSRKPELMGALPAESGAPDERSAFLAFGRWLSARSAAALEQAINALREKSNPFDMAVETLGGTPLEVQGRKSAQHAFVRFLSLSEAQRASARLRLENQRLSSEYETLASFFEALDMPFWLRSTDGRLKWVNRAYAEAVEAADQETAVREARELLGTQARETIAKHHQASAVFEQTLSTVVRGDRHMYAITDVSGRGGSAGIAVDRSEIEVVREEFERTVRSHGDTLDQLTTAVAIFDAGEKLRFYNQAFQKLWDLDTAFLESAPENALLLDRLRSEGKLAEQPEWRRWKETVLSAYRAVDSQEHWWHLPDGRTVRVVANPQPKGGVTWIFENLTERIDLESRYNAAVRVQGETLDNLAEGVVVFGPDGRVRLSNPTFAGLWGLTAERIKRDTHIAAIRTECDKLAVDSPWEGFVASVTGFDDERRDRHGQVELKNGVVLRYAVIHLPNGLVMMTFVDITDSVNVERALLEKNEALQRADQLKNDFVQHVSYELRSPLTNIIGFTELLGLPDTGPLTRRQREYVDHIGTSSSVLLTIVNDILDLATVDAGIMELDIGEVRVEQTIAAAAEVIADRLHEHSIELRIDSERAPASFSGDEHRVRQILSNLLSNAANYAPEGSIVTLSCVARGETVEFSVHDNGPGMPPEVMDTVFRRFESHANGGRRRGAGLGLAIVKSFVELHGGSVSIESGADRGTTVTCRFPMVPSGVRIAAE